MFARLSKDHSLSGLFVLAFAFSFILLLPDRAFSQYECNGDCRRDLAIARTVTAKYHKEVRAGENGYVVASGCVESPAGGMGYHYIKPSLVDLSVDAAEPELLLYEPTGNGERRLVAVEYFVPVIYNGQPWISTDPPPGPINPAPELFGQTFDGPMAGHDPMMPWHYELHVWLWKNNPNGMFASYNPTVDCP